MNIKVAIVLAVVAPVARSIVCFLCDSYDGNCQGSTCVGNACIKRHAFMENGLVRVQKMCQVASEPFIEHCEKNVLWKGAIGIECICPTDYCNHATITSPKLFWLLAATIYFRTVV